MPPTITKYVLKYNDLSILKDLLNLGYEVELSMTKNSNGKIPRMLIIQIPSEMIYFCTGINSEIDYFRDREIYTKKEIKINQLDDIFDEITGIAIFSPINHYKYSSLFYSQSICINWQCVVDFLVEKNKIKVIEDRITYINSLGDVDILVSSLGKEKNNIIKHIVNLTQED